MTSDNDIYRSAHLLIKRHGDDARDRARAGQRSRCETVAERSLSVLTGTALPSRFMPRISRRHNSLRLGGAASDMFLKTMSPLPGSNRR